MQDKYYVSSNGDILRIADMDAVHLVNAYAKKHRELYNCKSKREYNEVRETMENLHNEIENRLKGFYEGLEDE